MLKTIHKNLMLLLAASCALLTHSVLAAEQLSPANIKMVDNDIAGNLIQTTLGLMVILAVIAGAAWLAKRFGNFKVGAQGRMKIIGGLSLGTRERVVLLEVGNQQLLLGVAPGRIQTLHVLDEPLPADTKPVEAKGFAEKLSMAMNVARGKRD